MTSNDEKQIRRELAACYRLAAHFGWDDLIANHISARLPGRGEAFLINPFGMLFEEVTASSLIKIDHDGNKLEPSPHPVNQAGFVIHSAIHQARPDAACVVHVHSRDGTAVSCTEAGLLPLNQSAMLIAPDVAFHEYEGVATDIDERARIQADLGQHNLMLLRNHGTLTLGQSIGSAFYRMYLLEWACTVQVRTLAMNSPVHPTPRAALERVAREYDAAKMEAIGDFAWPALMRKVERLYPDFAD